MVTRFKERKHKQTKKRLVVSRSVHDLRIDRWCFLASVPNGGDLRSTERPTAGEDVDLCIIVLVGDAHCHRKFVCVDANHRYVAPQEFSKYEICMDVLLICNDQNECHVHFLYRTDYGITQFNYVKLRLLTCCCYHTKVWTL